MLDKWKAKASANRKLTTAETASPGDNTLEITSLTGVTEDIGDGPDSAQDTVHRDRTAVPGETAPPTGKQEQALANLLKDKSVPTGPEGYTLPVPAEARVDREQADRFRALAHTLGLTRGQAATLVLFDIERMQAMDNQLEQWLADQRETWAGQVRDEWRGDRFQANLDMANRALDRFGDQEFLELLRRYGLDNHPAMARMLHRVGQALSEDQGTVSSRLGMRREPKRGPDGEPMLRFKSMEPRGRDMRGF